MNVKVNINLDDREIQVIDSLIRCGNYSSRSEFIEKVLKERIAKEAHLEMPQILLDAQREIKEKGISYEQALSSLRQIRRELYNEQYGDD
ncbi:MAG: ribbon-helix-helix domain-containing protein [Methanosarcinales archaeon]